MKCSAGCFVELLLTYEPRGSPCRLRVEALEVQVKKGKFVRGPAPRSLGSVGVWSLGTHSHRTPWPLEAIRIRRLKCGTQVGHANTNHRLVTSHGCRKKVNNSCVIVNGSTDAWLIERSRLVESALCEMKIPLVPFVTFDSEPATEYRHRHS